MKFLLALLYVLFPSRMTHFFVVFNWNSETKENRLLIMDILFPNVLQNRYMKLKSEIDNLKRKKRIVKENYKSLKSSYTKLSNLYDSLYDKYMPLYEFVDSGVVRAQSVIKEDLFKFLSILKTNAFVNITPTGENTFTITYSINDILPESDKDTFEISTEIADLPIAAVVESKYDYLIGTPYECLVHDLPIYALDKVVPMLPNYDEIAIDYDDTESIINTFIDFSTLSDLDKSYFDLLLESLPLRKVYYGYYNQIKDSELRDKCKDYWNVVFARNYPEPITLAQAVFNGFSFASTAEGNDWWQTIVKNIED